MAATSWPATRARSRRYEVIRTIDGPIFLTACFTEHGYCVHTDKCIVRDPLQKVHEGILRLLASISISDMSADSAKGESRNTESKNSEFEPADAAL